MIVAEYTKRFAKKRFYPGATYIPASGKAFGSEEMIAMTEAVLDGWWTEGRFADAFEKKFASWLGSRYCITTTSGSSANLLAIATLTSAHLGNRRLRPGDEVITLAAGFPTTINPIILYGLIPVFVDIDRMTCNVNLESLQKAITKKTKAIFLPHHIGNPFNVRAVQSLTHRHGLWFVEDCCDALGSVYQGKKVGTFGDLATFSFYAGHHMTMGEGGAVVTREGHLASITRSVRDWGREFWFKTGSDKRKGKGLGSRAKGILPSDYDHKFIFSEIGYNLKITDIQAALGLEQLKKISLFTQKRIRNYKLLVRQLQDLDRYFDFQKAEKGTQPSWFGFLITLKPNCPFTRETLIHFLHSRRIMTRMFLACNLLKQPYFRSYKIRYRVAGSLANTDYILRNAFWVGLYHGLTEKHCRYLTQSIRNFVARY